MGGISGIVQKNEPAPLKKAVGVREIALRDVVEMASIDVAKADFPAQRDRSPKDVVHRIASGPRLEEFIGEQLDRKRKIVPAEHVGVSQKGFPDEFPVVVKGDARVIQFRSLVPALKNPSVARDKAIGLPVVAFQVGHDVRRQTAEGTNFDNRRIARKMANRPIKAVDVTALKHSRYGELKPSQILIRLNSRNARHVPVLEGDSNSS